ARAGDAHAERDARPRPRAHARPRARPPRRPRSGNARDAAVRPRAVSHRAAVRRGRAAGGIAATGRARAQHRTHRGPARLSTGRARRRMASARPCRRMDRPAMTAISVVMGVYNGASTLAATLDSIVGQTEGDFECIVVDDGSTDATPAILAEYA